MAEGNPQCFIPAMSPEQQRLIASQQLGGRPLGDAIGQREPTNPPSFYIPDKPQLVGPRAINTVAFTTSLGVICLNAAWGEPIAIAMCTTGLMGVAYKLGTKVFLVIAKQMLQK
jgi:hypothetical protein